MKNIFKGKRILLLVCFLILCSVGCFLLVYSMLTSDIRPAIVTPSEGYYEIETDRILYELDQGNTDVFIPMMETPEIADIIEFNTNEPVAWKQADYYQVARELHSFVWGEQIEEWQLEEMTLKLNCDEASIGPQQMHIKIFKIEDYREDGKSRFIRRLIIYPRDNIVNWSEVEKYPASGDKRSINLERQKITADEALTIAEENGGLEARTNVENDCSIYISRVVGANKNRWYVAYSSSVDSDLFIMYIDPISGKFERK